MQVNTKVHVDQLTEEETQGLAAEREWVAGILINSGSDIRLTQS